MARTTNTKQKIELTVESRTGLGRNAMKQVRAADMVPGVLYGKDIAAQPLQVSRPALEKVVTSAGESTLVYVTLGKEIYPTILYDVTRDVRSGLINHVDFRKVRLDQKVSAKVTVVFVGESPAVRDQNGIFVRNSNEIEVEALPQDLPHEISVDISGLASFGDQITLGDLKLPSGVTAVGELTEIVATVQEPISEEALQASLAEPTTDVSAVEEIKKEKPEGDVEAETETPAPEAAAEEKPEV